MAYKIYDKKRKRYAFDGDTFSTKGGAEKSILLAIAGALSGNPSASDYKQASKYKNDYVVKQIATKKPTAKKKVVRKK